MNEMRKLVTMAMLAALSIVLICQSTSPSSRRPR